VPKARRRLKQQPQRFVEPRLFSTPDRRSHRSKRTYQKTNDYAPEIRKIAAFASRPGTRSRALHRNKWQTSSLMSNNSTRARKPPTAKRRRNDSGRRGDRDKTPEVRPSLGQKNGFARSARMPRAQTFSRSKKSVVAKKSKIQLIEYD